jgi:phosphate transport system permease protein
MDPTAAILPDSHTKIPSVGASAQARGARRFDLFFTKATVLAGWGTVALLAWITLQIAYEAWPAIHQFHLGFLFSQKWDTDNDIYGALPFIYGTLVSSALALVIATPLGVAIAIFLTEDYLPPAAQDFFKFTVELLAAIPSVIYGLWGLAVVIPITNPMGNWLNAHFGWCPLFSTPASGPCFLPASFVLAIMVLPTIAALSRTALKATPSATKEGALALGATRWEVIRQISLPMASTGIVGACVLALGRAMGETMALAMLIGSKNQISASLFAPANTIASLLANSFGEATGMQIAALMYLSFILMVLTLAINALAEWVLEATGATKRHI